MIVGVDSADSLLETIKGQRLVASLFGISFGAMLIAGITSSGAINARGLTVANNFRGSNIKGLAELIFGRYLLAFEVTSALLITAALGAMVLAHRERVHPRKTQAQLQRERTLSGHPTPLPAPGVMATNNAVNVPGLLPDGSPSQASLPKPFQSNGDDETTTKEVTK
jgi:NADH-quinone oxidoreductase subunit J